jgi:hypothetical protein
MRNLFKKRPVAIQEVAQNKISVLLDFFYKHIQAKWVQFMNRITARLSSGHLKVCLVLFILLGSSSSILLMVKSFSAEHAIAFRISHATKTETISDTRELRNGNDQISKKEYRKLSSFRKYMDSLTTFPAGKITYDSIIHLHPGLMDSLRAVEN